ncbi:very-long-chain 3-oxoacyl-CoA reductase-A-like [Pseudoliparis swirei]|uniref:very-long-chain 3-oxoacyl-CoA reductase-A-like n=1 Tax=Pseudoliparis swirei TaxID=2059687 RepID=UPI0024BEF89B|nr:very-long-chain 3-oxoacyl-CoA reductase-A-like [Pseudoliparis swirei]
MFSIAPGYNRSNVRLFYSTKRSYIIDRIDTAACHFCLYVVAFTLLLALGIAAELRPHAHRQVSTDRKKGAILNISSASGMYPVPLLTVYSASKAFVDFFSRGLHAEYKSKGVIVQRVLPFFVATKLSKIRRATLDKPSPERYVSAELNTVGLQSQTNGYLPHAVMDQLC